MIRSYLINTSCFKRLFAILAGILILNIPQTLFAAQKFEVCLAPFTTEGLHPRQTEYLRNFFRSELTKIKGYNLIEEKEIVAAEIEMNESDPEKRKSDDYYFFLADMVEADVVITVTIQKTIKNRFVFLAQTLDVFDRRGLDIFIQESNGSKEGMLAALSTLAQQLGGISDDEIVISFLARLEADIAFCSNRDGDWDIYLLEADERYPIPLTTNFVTDFSPSWSPDGKKIVFSTRRSRNYEIIVLDTMDGEENMLTRNRIMDVTPNWGATPNLITYSSMRKNQEIILHDLTTKKARRITRTDADEYFPHLAVDGKSIAYSSGEPSQIYSIDIEERKITRLLNDDQPSFNPVYSPDGRKIAFETTRDGNYEIYLMNADGSGLVNITNNPADDHSPTFSPSGKWLAFSSDREGNNEIYVMNLQGKFVTNITQNPKDDRLPSWSPVHLKRKL